MDIEDPEDKHPASDDALIQWREHLHMLGPDGDKLGGPSRESWELWNIDYYSDGRGSRIPLAEEDIRADE